MNCPLGPLGMRACRMYFHIGSPFSVRYVSGLRLASIEIEARLFMAQMPPDRKARLFLVSSQASPPSSQASCQRPTANLTDSIVSLLLSATVLPSASTSLTSRRFGTDHSYFQAINKAVQGNNFAKCAVETALVDALGKRSRVTAAELLGGAHS